MKISCIPQRMARYSLMRRSKSLSSWLMAPSKEVVMGAARKFSYPYIRATSSMISALMDTSPVERQVGTTMWRLSPSKVRL